MDKPRKRIASVIDNIHESIIWQIETAYLQMRGSIRSRNKDTIAAKTKERYLNNRERRLAYMREYHSKNKDIMAAKYKEYYEKNRYIEAVLRELIPKNPALSIHIPKREAQAKEYVFLNAEEANRLLQCLNGHPLQEVVFVALYYGLRRSEALGLKWNALDFEKDSLSIQHTIVKNVTIVAKDKTKTATSRGSYRLLPEIKDVLLAIRRRQKENRLLFGKEYIQSDYVFTWPNGKLFHPCYVTRGFQRALKNAGLPKMRFHDLRHA